MFKDIFRRQSVEQTEAAFLHNASRMLDVFDVSLPSTIMGFDYYGSVKTGQIKKEIVARAGKRKELPKIIFKTKRELNYYRNLVFQGSEISDYVKILYDTASGHEDSLVNILNSEDRESKRKEGETHLAGMIAGNMMLVAAELMYYRIDQKIIDLVSKYDTKRYKPGSIDLINHPSIITTISGVSIESLFANRDNFPPSKFLEFLVGAQLLAAGKNPKEDIDRNLATHPEENYPAMVAFNVLQTATLVNNFYFAEGKILDFVPPSAKHSEEVKKTALEIYKLFQGNLVRVHKAILNPESEEFIELKRAVEGYMRANEMSKLVALHVLFSGDEDYLKKLYRVAKQQSSSGPDKEFYSKLLGPLQEFISKAEKNLLSVDDANLIFSEHKPLPVSIKELERKAANIITLSKSGNFLIDQAPELQGMITPNRIVLHINKENPKIFSIVFEYRDPTGEPITISVRINSKKYPGGFEWSFIESPSEMIGIKSILLHASNTVLTEVEKFARQDNERKKIKKIRPEKPAEISVEETEEPEGDGQLDFIGRQIFQRERLQNIILMPEEKHLQKLLGSLSIEDKKDVLEGINNFNERGVGKFYMLLGRDAEGKPMYALRTKSTSHGGIRVLVREVGAANSRRHYEIVEIKLRRDIYKRRLDLK